MKVKAPVLLSCLLVAFQLLPTAAVAASAEPPPTEARKVSDDVDVGDYPDTTVRRVATFHGRKVAYTATSGRIAIKGPDGTVDAQMFYVAYTKDGATPGSRPVTFLVNGGPGAATAWLHLGGVGPRKIVLNPDGSVPAPPARLADNPESPLDRTDLVFIDAPGTGFSRLSGDSAKTRLLNKEGDLQAFATFVQSYLRANNRFSSPLYLWGESYGSFRMAGLSDTLVRQGVPVKGIILLSSALDFGVLQPSLTNDLPYLLLVPSYASIAAHHGLLEGGARDDDRLREEATAWAMDVYGPALARGNRLSAEERSKIVAGLVRFTGLDARVIEQNNLRIDVPEFMKQLNARRGVITGRTDGRMVGPPPQGNVEEPFYDPAMGALTPAFASAASQYILDELGSIYPLAYRMYSRDVATRFDLKSGRGYAETLGALQSTVVKDSNFRVLSMMGVYDLATPYLSMEYSLEHMPLPADYRRHITHVRLPGGHMAYDDAAALRMMNDAVVRFIDAGEP